jgi:ligand-binding sensor domain-containing protein
MNYSLTEYFDDVRIRHIMSDSNDDLWFSTFTHQMGLVCRQHNGSILQFTTDNGMPSNEIRCTYEAADGSIIAGTNAGIAIIRDEQVVDVIDAEDGVDNTVILTVCEGDNGQILAGSDGNGMYLIENGNVTHIGTADGLTSDVVMRITRDETRDLYWIVTSNSIEYMRDGVIINVTTFPYNNNFEIIPDHENNLWVMSSQGVYVVNADDAINDDITDYRLFDVANGLTSVPVAHCHCSTDGEGNLYIAGQTGVSRVNIDSFFEASARVQTGVRAVYFNDEQILPDENGDYVIPAGGGRI